MAVGDISQVNVDFISKNSTLLARTETTSLQIEQMVAALVGPTEFLYHGRPDFMSSPMMKKTAIIRFQGEANKMNDITTRIDTTNTVGTAYEFSSNPMFEYNATLRTKHVGEAFSYQADRIAGYDIMQEAMAKVVYNIANNEHAESYLAFNRLKDPSSSVTDTKTIAKDHFQGKTNKNVGWSDADTGGGVTEAANAELKCNYGGLLRMISKAKAGFLGAGAGESLCVQIDSQDLIQAQASSKRMISSDYQPIMFGTQVVGQDVVFTGAFPDVKFITTGDSGAYYALGYNADGTAKGSATQKKDLANYGKAVVEGATPANKLIRTVAFLPTGLRWFHDGDEAKAISQIEMLDQTALNGTVYMSLFMSSTAHALGRYVRVYEHVTANEDITVVT